MSSIRIVNTVQKKKKKKKKKINKLSVLLLFCKRIKIFVDKT